MLVCLPSLWLPGANSFLAAKSPAVAPTGPPCPPPPPAPVFTAPLPAVSHAICTAVSPTGVLGRSRPDKPIHVVLNVTVSLELPNYNILLAEKGCVKTLKSLIGEISGSITKRGEKLQTTEQAAPTLTLPSSRGVFLCLWAQDVLTGRLPASLPAVPPACLGRTGSGSRPHLISWQEGGDQRTTHDTNLFISHLSVSLQQLVIESDKSPFLKYFLEIMRFPTDMISFQTC